MSQYMYRNKYTINNSCANMALFCLINKRKTVLNLAIIFVCFFPIRAMIERLILPFSYEKNYFFTGMYLSLFKRLRVYDMGCLNSRLSRRA